MIHVIRSLASVSIHEVTLAMPSGVSWETLNDDNVLHVLVKFPSDRQSAAAMAICRKRPDLAKTVRRLLHELEMFEMGA